MKECLQTLFETSFFCIILQAMVKKPSSRIFKGTPVLDKTRYPFHVQIMIKCVMFDEEDNQMKRITYFCGGVLLSNMHVLTAGHCVHDTNW